MRAALWAHLWPSSSTRSIWVLSRHIAKVVLLLTAAKSPQRLTYHLATRPAVSFIGGFRTTAPVQAASSRSVVIRNPSQESTSLDHRPIFAFRRIAGADIDFATVRAEPMNSSASGLMVRRLTVTMLTDARRPDTFTGSTFSPASFALNCATELGRIPTNFPVATRVVVSWTDNVTMLGAGGARPAVRKISVM